MPELEALAAEHGLGILEDACEALGAVDSEGRRVGARGNLATFAFYANKQMTTGEGGMIVPPSRRRRRPPAQRAQPGPRRRHGLARPRAASASTTASPTSPRRSASPRSRSSTSCCGARAASPRSTASGWPGSRASSAPIAGRGAEGRSWFVYVVRLPDGVDRDAVIARLAERGVASKAYLPCIHLFPHLRELGYREGQFPVAEAASARSLALPFFPAMTEPRSRGCARSWPRRSSAPSAIIAPPMSRFRKDPDPRFWRLNRSIEFDWRLAPYDIDQSQAHARGLRGIGVLDDGRAGADRRRPRAGRARGWASTASSSRRPTRTSTWRSSACSARRSARSPASSTPAARATTRSPPTWRWSSRRTRCGRSSCCGAAMERLLELAERHRDWPMPGYTHLQRAQPVYLGHHLLAYFWMLARDVLRFQFALDSASVMPLGSGALAGVNWEIDRDAVADDLGFEHVSPNSIDGASNRDFVLDYLAAASTCAMHLSRLGSEIVIWSSSEFGFCELDESFSSGSSIMPQKKNPDSAELLRAKSPRVAADYAALLGRRCTRCRSPTARTCRRTRSRSSTRSTRSSSASTRPRGCWPGSSFDRERLEAASGDEMLAATEVADLLVRQRGAVPRGARDRRRAGPRRGRAGQAALRAEPEDELRAHSEHLDDSYYEVLQREQLAGVEADRGRHRLGAAGRADRARARDAGRGQGAGPRRALVKAAARAGPTRGRRTSSIARSTRWPAS